MVSVGRLVLGCVRGEQKETVGMTQIAVDLAMSCRRWMRNSCELRAEREQLLQQQCREWLAVQQGIIASPDEAQQ